MSKVTKLVAAEEGFKGHMYQDHLNVWTIGHGITQMTEDESLAVMEIKLNKLADQLRIKYAWFHRLNETRQAVIVSMAYQLGMTGFSKFKNMIAAIERNDWELVAVEARDSKAYKQTKNRWDRQISMLVNG